MTLNEMNSFYKILKNYKAALGNLLAASDRVNFLDIMKNVPDEEYQNLVGAQVVVEDLVLKVSTILSDDSTNLEKSNKIEKIVKIFDQLDY